MEEKSKLIQQMFDNIAPRYDFLNGLLSMRFDAKWRRVAVEKTQITPDMRVLDLACGTGDFIAEIKKQAPNASVIGGDFSLNMLKRAVTKLPTISFAAADAHCLPFMDSSFHRITMAFGFRNVTGKDIALKDFLRILKPNGKVCILEFSVPSNRLFAMVYKFYFMKILPAIGGFFSGNKKAYEYLPDSVYKFPKRQEYEEMIKNAGFENVEFHTLMFGAVTIAIMEK